MPGPLATVLIEQQLLSPEQADKAAEYATAHQVPEARAIVTLGYVPAGVIAEVVAAATHASLSADLALERTDPNAIHLLQSAQARLWGVIPMRFEGDTLIIAATAATASNTEVNDNLRLVLKRRPIRWLLATEPAVRAKLDAEYRAEAELTSITERATGGEEDTSALAQRFVLLVLNQAISDRASDIHIEPSERTVGVRFRIDGVLKDVPAASKSMQSAIINQLKILAGMDIGENRKPQDGRLTHTATDGKSVDFRVAALPTVWGEKIVLRILDNSVARLSLREFGLTPANQALFKESYTKPHGLILVTGPTGSGKSTTLYATLNEINRPEVNIITVEDPVEYRLPRINQIQVNPKAGLTFATALRTILRSDPDIVLLGEIRDQETATIAVEAAQTGHLVLTTLHTNNAPETPSRLIEMGVEPYLLAQSLECVVAQRLVRRLCSCKERYTPSEEELASAHFSLPADARPTFYRKVGCVRCADTGYQGRFAVQEVMPRSEGLSHAIATQKDSLELRKVAEESGFISLRADGWLRVANGDTSIEEVLRVVV